MHPKNGEVKKSKRLKEDIREIKKEYLEEKRIGYDKKYEQHIKKKGRKKNQVEERKEKKVRYKEEEKK